MRRHYRTLALAITLGLAGVAFAQSNPTGRGGPDRDPFSSGSLTAPSPRSEDFGRSSFGQHGMGRGTPRTTTVTVTPVPEPSQWAMMLAGLALVGWIVRRNSKR
ncbi:MAG TPA: PEPxxWA-CTERM sorting domain-containing protein [Usitatibacter sp.]|nr:PEPxxWA-CTERM sorting domain-containing protein [Usitatibacter sp.]